VVAFDFFFVPPVFEFNIADLHYTITFLMLFLVGLLVSDLAERLRKKQQALAEKERRTALLYELSLHLASASTESEAIQILVEDLSTDLGRAVAVYQPDAHGVLQVVAHQGQLPWGTIADEAMERAWTKYACTGLGSASFQHMPIACVPILDVALPLALLVLDAGDRDRADESQMQLVKAMAQHTGLCIAKARAVQSNKNAEVRARSEESRSALLSAVSHDLRTPLAAITEAATMLRDDTHLFAPAQRDDITRTICEQAEQMDRQIANLLDMTRFVAGFVVAQRSWISCKELLCSALNLAQNKVLELNVTLNVPDSLPLLHVDTLLFERLFANLLENAVKYAGTGARVEIVASHEAGTLAVDVADNGPGLPEGSEERIFDKFYRAAQIHTTGTGLGLAICRAIAELHEGTIVAFNRAEGGAVFRVCIPIAKVMPDTAALLGA
jgi:two-component system sensor histidine kinase KdpD